MILHLHKSERPEKRLKAVLVVDGDREKTIHFGQRGGSTYIDHGDPAIRRAYIARHKPSEDWSHINAGSLSRYILWEHKTLAKAAAAYGRRFGVKVVVARGCC